MALLVAAASACGAPPAADPPPPVPIDPGPVVAPPPPLPPPPAVEQGPQKLTLDDPEAVVPVPGTELTVRLLGGWHKSFAPLVGVDVQFARGTDLAEVGWRIEQGAIDPAWQDLEGRRYDEASATYVETAIPGWQVRLLSVDDASAGGSPTAITIEVRTTPPP